MRRSHVAAFFFFNQFFLGFLSKARVSDRLMNKSILVFVFESVWNGIVFVEQFDEARIFIFLAVVCKRSVVNQSLTFFVCLRLAIVS